MKLIMHLYIHKYTYFIFGRSVMIYEACESEINTTSYSHYCEIPTAYCI